jgi:signal transduction histidine kinase
MRLRLSIRVLLFGVTGLALLAPLAAAVGLRLYDIALLRQTERQLIAESVLIGEALRDAYVRLEPSGITAGDKTHRPPTRSGERYSPVEPRIDIGTKVLPPSAPSEPRVGPSAPRITAAGRAIEPLMQRAQTFNLSGVRVLDESGCVVATTGGQRNVCLGAAPEVRRALTGRYASSMRERVSDEPDPPLGDIRRRGRVRVFTALPVFHDGVVIAVVCASRTGLDAVSSLWQNRRELLLGGLGTLSLIVLATLLLAFAIAQPLRRLTDSARAITQGGSPELAVSGFAPREIEELAGVLRAMTVRLQRRAEEAAERSAHVSHELKTPLAGIRGAVELLREGWKDMPEAQRERFMANIDADAERMERLVTGLLALARIESEAAKHAEPIDAATALRSLLERYADVRLELDERTGSLGSLNIRQEHLASVVLNLVENARRHGAGQLVSVRASRQDEHVRLLVTDRGPGVSEANRARVFERFFTTERDRGGTGLGLAVVKAVAEARGGSVSVESRPGETTFTVVL